MKDVYANEREGQLDFYNDYLPLVDKNIDLEDVLSDNNDGVVNGNILEFKLVINNPNSVLFQAIKYLSARRIKGKPVPKNIMLISLNDKKLYLYDSESYLADIEKVYYGSASINNTSFSGGDPIKILHFYDNPLDEQEMIHLLKQSEFTKINLDENCIVGWATRFYKENPQARKADFIGDLTGKTKIVGEIRKPNQFKEYINPYKEATNVKFNYLMDKLNDEFQKKILGAFYTPDLYAKKSLELVRKAIERVPEGNDYVIIDRCAGTGNLERQMTDEELSHCILSTYEYYEYKVLIELLGDKVRHIIPPTEKEDTFDMGLVRGADALSKEFVESPIIKQYIDDPNVTIILYENPPYSETTSIEYQKTGKGKENSSWKNSFVVQEMKKEVKGVATNELANAFIWSAFKYYLRQPTDSYVVYSPVKYWKAQHLINKKFIDGLAVNRKHFHTNTNACIMVALWSNENDFETKEITLKAYDIKDDELVYEGNLYMKRIFSIYSEYYYDKRDVEKCDEGIIVGLDGCETIKKDNQISVKKIYSPEIVGYLVASASGFDNPRLTCVLTISGLYSGHGFYLRKDNYLEKLPMFAAGKYTDNYNDWKIMSFVMKSADKKDEFFSDVKSKKNEQWLLKILLWTTLTNQSHMRSLYGSDGRFYRNELCLDTNNGLTLAAKDLRRLKKGEKEKALLLQWAKVLHHAKKTHNYNKDFSYGVFQISKELNTSHKDEITGVTVYDYPELNGHLNTLRALVKDYYLTEIVPTLFEYEFLK